MTSAIPQHQRDARRGLTSVTRLLEEPRVVALIATYSQPVVLDAARAELESARSLARAERKTPSVAELAESVTRRVARMEADRLRPVINATGVILHTGLGRAVLPRRAAAALSRMDRCCNLQIDMQTGRRGKRNAQCEALLCRLTGAQAALIVNNNAAATLLILKALCDEREVIVSRGQLIEIGGSYRLPDCIHQSGAKLVEVGTTNKTHVRDYEAALNEATGAILHVNPSNYRVVGFHKEVPIDEIVGIKKNHPELLVIDDLGCGALVDLRVHGLPHEPTVQEAIAAGADLCCFSGDKLIGGPQAGIIVGRADLIAMMRKHPLTRMLRIGKLTDMALEQTLRLFLEPERLFNENPTLRMLIMSAQTIKGRATRLKRRIEKTSGTLHVRLLAGSSATGGGSLPDTEIPTWLLGVRATHGFAERLLMRMREHEPPVIARIEQDEVLIDVRTVLEDEEPDLLNALLAAATPG